MTTRRLMILVALVAVALWAVMHLPETIDQHFENRRRAAAEAVREDEAKDAYRKALVGARRIQAEHDRWRNRARIHNPLTERYLTARDNVALAEAQYQLDLAAFHSALKRHYQHAAWIPWLSDTTHLAQPRDPRWKPAPKYEPGKHYESVFDGATAIAFSPVTEMAALGRHDQAIRLLAARTGEEEARLTLEGGRVDRIAFSPDGKLLAATGYGARVQVWEVATRHEARRLHGVERLARKPHGPVIVAGLSFAPDGKSLVVAAWAPVGGKSNGGIFAVRRFDTETGAVLWEHQGVGNGATGVACSPDGKTVALADGGVTLVDLRTGLTKRTLKPAAGYVLDVSYSPDGRTLAGAGSNTVPQGGYGGEGRVTLWDTTSGAILHTLNGPTGRGQSVAFSPDGRTVATAGPGPKEDKRRTSIGALTHFELSELKLFDAATGRTIWTFEGESEGIFSLGFSRDGKALGFCDWNYCYLIDAESGDLIDILAETTRTLRVHQHPSATTTSGPKRR